MYTVHNTVYTVLKTVYHIVQYNVSGADLIRLGPGFFPPIFLYQLEHLGHSWKRFVLY